MRRRGVDENSLCSLCGSTRSCHWWARPSTPRYNVEREGTEKDRERAHCWGAWESGPAGLGVER